MGVFAGHADAVGSAGSPPTGNFEGGSGPGLVGTDLKESFDMAAEKRGYKILIGALAAIPCPPRGSCIA